MPPLLTAFQSSPISSSPNANPTTEDTTPNPTERATYDIDIGLTVPDHGPQLPEFPAEKRQSSAQIITQG